jgi:hypothetical protein
MDENGIVSSWKIILVPNRLTCAGPTTPETQTARAPGDEWSAMVR